jgi:hypothetical protein
MVVIATNSHPSVQSFFAVSRSRLADRAKCAEPAIEPEFRRQRLGTSSPKVWADCYLLAFATVAGLKLLTFDWVLRAPNWMT